MISAEFTNECVSISDADCAVLSTNLRYAQLLGRPMDGVVGKVWKVWVHPKDLPACEAAFYRVLALHEPVRLVRKRR